jgi:hypothetical protein
LWLFSGDALVRVSEKAAPFSGQKVAMFADQALVDDKQEVLFFAISVDAVLGGAGWVGPTGERIVPGSTGLLNNLSFDPPDRKGINGVLVQTGPTASPRTEMAADAVVSALESEHLFAYHNKNSRLTDLPVPVDDDLIAITVGRRLLP